MKKLLIFMAIYVMCGVSQAHAFYTVDGDVLDWGIDLNAVGADIAGYLDSHIPGGTADSETEDNADNDSSWFRVGPGFTDYGNHYDAEAMYFDNDDTYAYLAVITGLSSSPNEEFPSGDIFFSTDSDPFADNSYDFALDVSTGNFYTVGGMEDVVNDWSPENPGPWRLTRDGGDVDPENGFIGNTDLVYSSLINTHYVIETKIPLAWLQGLDGDIWAHWTMKCGNDYLNLQGSVHTPEPATVLLLGSGMFGFFGLRRRKRLV